jgi:hypothetical protein
MLPYPERDGVTRADEKGRLYSAVENEADGRLDRLAQLVHMLGGVGMAGVLWRLSRVEQRPFG